MSKLIKFFSSYYIWSILGMIIGMALMKYGVFRQVDFQWAVLQVIFSGSIAYVLCAAVEKYLNGVLD